MKSTRFAFWMLAALLAGCATQSDVATYIHPADGLRTDLIRDNPLDSPASSREMIWLNASRVFKSDTQYDYYLEVTYAANVETGFLDIGAGPSLVIVAGDREMKFTGNGSLNLRRSRKGVVNENALYLARAEDLRAIAAAPKVTVRVMGRNGTVQREFTPANSERFKKFVAAYVPAKP
jgi:hypothetical protein